MNLKKLLEKRQSLMAELDKLFSDAEKEERALTDDEQTRYDSLKAEIEKIDNTIESFQQSRKLTKDVVTHQTEEENKVFCYIIYRAWHGRA